MAKSIPISSNSVAKFAGALVSSSIRNAKPSNTKQLRKAKARLRSGLGNAAFMFPGMSTYFGQGAGDGLVDTVNALPGCKAKSLPMRLASILTSSGLAASSDSYWGDGNQDSSTLLASADPRLSFGVGWGGSSTDSFGTSPTGVRSIGGWMPRNLARDTSMMTFTPAGTVNKFRHYFATSSGNATVAQQIDSESPVNVNTNASPSCAHQDVTSGTASGIKTFKISRTGTGGSYFNIGVRAWDTSVSKLEIMNMGWASSKAAVWDASSSGYSPRSALTTVIADCVADGMPVVVFLGMDINDILSLGSSSDKPSDVSAYRTHMQGLITAWAGAGAEVVLVTGNPIANRDADSALILAVEFQLAVTNDIPIINMTDRFINWSGANNLGFMWDNYHSNAIGYADQAEVIANFIINA